MKIQLAYRFTGEDPEKTKILLKKIVEIFQGNGHETYTPIFDFNYGGKTKKQIYTDALDRIDENDALFVLIRGGEKSEGMLVELGYAVAKKKKIIIAIRKEVESRTLFYADKTIIFEDEEDLLNKIKEI